MANDLPLGIQEITHKLDCSMRTVRRYHAEGKIRTRTLRGSTSPIKIDRVDLKHLVKKKGGA